MLEKLSRGVIEAIFETLPVDVSFVDSQDTVQYFNKGKGRIFPRSPGVIGRKVQDCHPRKSLDAVNKLLEDFRSGRRDAAEFWIDLKGMKVHIRYFPIRDASGNYLGTLEVTQDITAIKTLEGEKRLAD